MDSEYHGSPTTELGRLEDVLQETLTRLRVVRHAMTSIGVITELTERKAVEHALAHSESRREAVLRAIPDLVFRVRRDGTVLDYSADRAAAFGLAPIAGHGKPLGAVVPQLAEQLQAFTERALRTGAMETLHYDAIVDGQLREFEARIAPGGSEVVVICRDVTAQRAAERIKDSFISMVSHELRTPLTSIRGALGLLAGAVQQSLAPRDQHLLGIAIKNTERLVRLTNDILDVERIRQGAFAIVPATCDARELLTVALDAVRPLAVGAEVTLDVEAQPAAVWGDHDRIVQVLVNILSNAIRYSPARARVVSRVEPRGVDVLFSIVDQGPGIAAEILPTIFQPFQPTDAPDVRRQGFGVGLFLSRSIVEAHAGRIWAESVVGRGTTLHVLLPAAVERPVPAQVGAGDAHGR